ncbi:MAG: ComEC/Rec2 family competence protein [Ekhidna sp.]
MSLGMILLLISVLLSSKKGFFVLRHLNGSIALILIFLIGGYATKTHYHTYQEDHYTSISSRINGFQGTILSPVNERKNHYRYDLQLHSYANDSSVTATNGVIHLYIKKDSLSTINFQYGDLLIVKGSFYSVPGPDNPNEFNYQQYLARQGIFSHAFVSREQVKLIKNSAPNFLLSWAYQIRDKANSIIDKTMPVSRENGIAKALLLGIKDHIDNDIKKAYSAAGAMHVLAVSGLHVGIVYMILQVFIGKLRQRGKLEKKLFGIISITAIWLYATITGLSPSVLRAATMFSLMAMSQMSTKGGNIYNTLGFAAFLLLLYDPYLIYSVGFQLSFAAVVGIVYIQPKLYRLLDFRWWIIDKAWTITCVSIAAQLSTFPLSAYYFHQFPTYFLVSNLIVIPAAFLMLIGGMLMLFAYSIHDELGFLVGKCLHYFMWTVNETISLVDIMPNSLIEWIYMDQVGLTLTYLIVITVIAGFHYRSFKTLIVATLWFSIFFGWDVYSNRLQTFDNQLIFFEVRDKTVIDRINGHEATLYIDSYKSDELELLSFQMNPSRLSSRLRPISESVQNLKMNDPESGGIKFGQVGGKKLIIFDSTTFHLNFKSPIETDIILINNQSIKSLKWLITHFHSDLILIGNKNSSYYSRGMKKQASSLGIEIHSLKEDGAFVFDLNEGIKKERTIQSAPFTTNPD